MSDTTGTGSSADADVAGDTSGTNADDERSAHAAAVAAEQHVARLLREAQNRAVAHGAVPEPRKGSAKPRRPGSLRHIAAVVIELRLYDLAVSPTDGPDHNPIDQALKGRPGRVANVDLVLAVARACHHIAGQEFGDAQARTYTAAARQADALRRRAEIAAKARPLDPVGSPPERPLAGATADAVTEPGAGGAEAPDTASGGSPGASPDGSPGTSPDGGSATSPAASSEGSPTTASRRRQPPRLTAVAALAAVAAASAGITWWATSGDSDARPSDSADARPMATQHIDPVSESAPTVLSCRDGVVDAGIIESPATIFVDSQATMVLPTLDFDTMNGSARYLSHQGRKYYWGRAGSDDHDPHSGGVRLLWRLDGETAWHECRKALPTEERDYVRTPAVPTVINNRAVTVKICLWRDDPYLENCTREQ
ncbi:hypothetical protein ACIBSV_07450 [Embleya sp. NPDC050154]|uniref:hypothetical protein n=1 Tax=unclassified Embleya TaxID=2699296 RepID=UPI00379519FC